MVAVSKVKHTHTDRDRGAGLLTLPLRTSERHVDKRALSGFELWAVG